MTVGIAANGSFVGMLGEHRDDVLVERLAGCARLLAAVEHGNRLDGGRQRVDERRCVEGPIEADLDQADLLALLRQQIHGLFGGFRTGTHQHDHALRIGGAVVIEQVIGATGLRRKAIHHRLHNPRNRGVKWAASFARLEEDVGVLRRAAQHGTVGTERVLAELDDVLVVDQRADGLVADGNESCPLRAKCGIRRRNE